MEEAQLRVLFCFFFVCRCAFTVTVDVGVAQSGAASRWRYCRPGGCSWRTSRACRCTCTSGRAYAPCRARTISDVCRPRHTYPFLLCSSLLFSSLHFTYLSSLSFHYHFFSTLVSALSRTIDRCHLRFVVVASAIRVQRHHVPLSALPCLHYRRALDRERPLAAPGPAAAASEPAPAATDSAAAAPSRVSVQTVADKRKELSLCIALVLL